LATIPAAGLGPYCATTWRRLTGVTLKIAAVYKLMHALGFSLQRAKAVYPERNEEECATARVEIKKFN
jgi:transposase